jgi:hypothetical protein
MYIINEVENKWKQRIYFSCKADWWMSIYFWETKAVVYHKKFWNFGVFYCQYFAQCENRKLRLANKWIIIYCGCCKYINWTERQTVLREYVYKRLLISIYGLHLGNSVKHQHYWLRVPYLGLPCSLAAQLRGKQNNIQRQNVH